MSRPLLLDLFCGQGGSAVGYWRAGFSVVGVDKDPQPNYPFPMVVGDALNPPFDLGDFDAIHASPPCQHFTAYGRAVKDIKTRYEDLIVPTRRLLERSRRPWVMENVVGAPLDAPVMLCGSMFRLDVQRHRLFEANWGLRQELKCDHKVWTPRFPPASNRTNLRKTVEVGVWRIPLDVQKQAMGVDWDVTLRGLSEAVPPAYTEHIGGQLMAMFEARVA